MARVLLFLHFEHHLPQLAGMHVDERLARLERPVEVTDVGVELEADRAARDHLRVLDLVGLRDIAQARDLADLLVERHEEKSEAEHRSGHERQALQHSPVGDPCIFAAVGRARVAHDLLPFHRLRPMAIPRNSRTAMPSTRHAAVAVTHEAREHDAEEEDERDRRQHERGPPVGGAQARV